MPSNASDREATFYLEEYKLLRQEILSRTQEQHLVERNVVITVVLLYIFLGTSSSLKINNEVIEMIRLLWLVPPILVLLGAGRWWGLHTTILSIGEYIRDYEKQIDCERRGWETFIENVRQGRHRVNLPWIVNYIYWKAHQGVWILAIVLTIGLAIFPPSRNLDTMAKDMPNALSAP